MAHTPYKQIGIAAKDAPVTEGVKYAGSKLKLIPQILRLVETVDAHTILDGFSGTTRVSQALAKQGYHVVSNDISVWSETFATCYLLNQRPAAYYRDLINHLNSVRPTAGWFTEHYGGLENNGCAVQADGLKKPWQVHNTQKLDAIRQEIEELKLPKIEKAVVLTSLVLALDQVDNTLGHFSSYLKQWSPRSYKELLLKPPMLFENTVVHNVYRRNIFDILPNLSVDLAYFDPPYGSNNEKMPPSRVRYASYYHLWTSVCLFDKCDLFGKAKRRVDTSDTISSSEFEDFRRNDAGRFIAVQAIENLIKSTQAKWIILSYSSGGRATSEELNEVLQSSGRILQVVEINYKKNVMAGMKWTNDWIRDAQEENREFLFLLEKA
ncbi:DNA adenine methylase [Alicyclobacillus sp. SO9]|uniref:DNA adenine methylase n=1 Tax=Alicyclobacillus sp. SO9 TaxID=2665646 RepID=UPI0018E8DBBB|nr:DNA adenine methylase [Alicyclobacillus sp. SO9]QQE78923.1 DNA adenine methylase [Alicyclobacillus sp. SO9]